MPAILQSSRLTMKQPYGVKIIFLIIAYVSFFVVGLLTKSEFHLASSKDNKRTIVDEHGNDRYGPKSPAPPRQMNDCFARIIRHEQPVS